MSRQHISRRRVLGGAGAGIAASMAGCLPGGGDGDGGNGGSGGDGGDGGPDIPEQDRSSTIHVLTDYTGENSWDPKWEEIKEGFEGQDEADLNIEKVGMQGSGEDRLSTLIQAGDAPEMFMGTITQVGDLIGQGQTIILNDTLDELVEANGDMLSRSTVEVEGDVRMLPHGVYLGGCFQYRTDIYEQLGLSVPETWDELLENAKAIDEAEEGPAGSARGFALPAVRSGKSGSDLANFVYNNEGQFWRYTNEEENEVELAFSEEDIVPALEIMDDLAQYSPDPANMTWGPNIVQWIQGNLGQCIMNNAWLNGVAYANDSPIWQVTEQALIPMRDRSMDPIDRGWALADGTPILRPSHNHEGAKALWKFMYGTPDDAADKNLTEPMRFLPAFEDVMGSDTYQNADVFQDAPSLLERNQRMLEEFAPELGADRPSNAATLYAGRFSIDAELVSSVVVEGTDPSEAHAAAVEKYNQRLEEGRTLAEQMA